MYVFLANVTLALHVGFVAFVVLMVPAIYLGRLLHWSWVRILWLRLLHLVGIVIVAAQAWAGVICPLTTLEMWLRRRGGAEAYSGGFVEHWMNELLYWDFPWWVFVLLYSLFATLVLATWVVVPPARK
ncbi:MAG: DUF2784 domain-containing protein [Halioglobus sp.]|nr:DUF2784 domain-containing protein [Halioglobus sp.]